MPVRKLTFERPLLELLAIMLFPYDRNRQRGWMACALTKNVAEGLILLSPALHQLVAKEIWNLSRTPQQIFEEKASRTRKAKGACRLFEVQLSCAIHHPCYYVSAKGRLELFRAFICETLGASDSSLAKDWAEFNSIVHLWRAYFQIAHAAPEREIDASKLSELCSMANTFCKIGIDQGILRPDRILTIEGDMISTHDVDPEIPPLNESELEILDRLHLP